MDKATLLAFIHRIVSCGNPLQSKLALQQLAEILRQQKVDWAYSLVTDAIEGLQDLVVMARSTTIGHDEITEARRAADRRRREAEAARYGRCC